MKIIVVTIASVIVLFGCAPSIYFNKEYADQDFKGRKVVVSFVDTLSIKYEGNMDNEFPPENRQGAIKQYLANAIVKTFLDSSVFSAGRIEEPYCNLFRKANLQWSDSAKFQILVPAPECPVPAGDDALWLFVEQPTVVSKPWIQIIMVYMVPVGAIPHKPLNISSKFVYWDAARKQPVAWGNAVGSYDQGPAVTIENWKKASRTHALSMIRKTAFAKKPAP